MSMRRTSGMRLVHATLLAIFLAGCAKHLSHSPTPRFSVDDARAVVTRTLEEQNDPHRPTSIEVTDEKIDVVYHRVSRRVFSLFAGATTIPQGKTIYFDDLGTPDIYHRRGLYLVRVRDRSHRIRLQVFCRERSAAERFADAIATLQREFAPKSD